MSKIDLHIHSNYSDGSDTLKELAQNIINAGLKTFALTDHDTIEGCSKMQMYIPNTIKFIPSTELTCKANKIKCHILGYNCDYRNSTLLNLIEKGKILRKNKLETRINYLKDTWNIVLTEDELNWLYTRKSVVKTHIANVLVKRGLAKDNLEAMDKFLNGCKSGDTRFSGEEAISAINKSGGIPIWAHPLGGEGEEHLKEDVFYKKLKEMLQFGIKGLECYYSRYNKDEIDFLIKCAKEYNLFITGGSDYHGKNKSNIKLGQLNVEYTSVDYNALNILKHM